MSTAVIAAEPGKKKPGVLSLAPKAGHLSLSQVIRRLFRFALLLLAARLLGVETFGIYALMLTTVEMVALISGAGYVDYLTREVAKLPGCAGPLAARVTQFRFLCLVPAVAIALAALKMLGFSTTVITNAALLSLSLIPRVINDSAQGVMKGLWRFASLPWVEFAQGCILLAVAPFLIFHGFGLRGVIAAEVAAATGGALCAVLSVAPLLEFKSSNVAGLRQIARALVAFNIYPFIATVYDRLDVVVLAKLAGNFATGIYSMPYRAFSTLQVIPYGIMGALFPGFSSSAAGHDARQDCSRAMEVLYITALLIVLGTLAFVRPAVLLVLGSVYADSASTVKILVWASVPAFLNNALITLLLAAGREKAFVLTATICTVFNLSANLLLIPRFSYYGAATVTGLTELLLLGQNFYLIKKYLGKPVLPKDSGKISAAFLATLGGFLLLQRWMTEAWAGILTWTAFAVFAAWMVRGMFKFRMAVGQQP